MVGQDHSYPSKLNTSKRRGNVSGKPRCDPVLQRNRAARSSQRHFVVFVPDQSPQIVQLHVLDVVVNEANIHRARKPLGQSEVLVKSPEWRQFTLDFSVPKNCESQYLRLEAAGQE